MKDENIKKVLASEYVSAFPLVKDRTTPSEQVQE